MKDIKNTDNGISVTVNDPEQVDSEESFISLDLGIKQVKIDGNNVIIQIEQQNEYFDAIKAML